MSPSRRSDDDPGAPASGDLPRAISRPTVRHDDFDGELLAQSIDVVEKSFQAVRFVECRNEDADDRWGHRFASFSVQSYSKKAISAFGSARSRAASGGA